MNGIIKIILRVYLIRQINIAINKELDCELCTAKLTIVLLHSDLYSLNRNRLIH